jgi:hypothetical protein
MAKKKVENLSVNPAVEPSSQPVKDEPKNNLKTVLTLCLAAVIPTTGRNKTPSRIIRRPRGAR